MSMHKIPPTPIEEEEEEEEGLRAHGLDIRTPSQLSDVFRQGVAWGHTHGSDHIRLLQDLNHRSNQEITRLRALSVEHIMLDIVPGDGDGHEVYAKSVDDVVKVLGDLWSKAEDAQEELAASQAREAQMREALNYERSLYIEAGSDMDELGLSALDLTQDTTALDARIRAERAKERERCCAAIKAADDEASKNDYMLDSDDCIRVISKLGDE